MTNKRLQSIVLELLAVACVILAVYYFVTPADKLLHFMPGYEVGVQQAHIKHGLAALVLAAAIGSLLWFSTGKKSSGIANETIK